MSILRSCAAAASIAVAPLVPAQDQKPPAPSADAAVEASARPGAGRGLVVGVVDLGKAFDTYPRVVKERERLKKMHDSYDEQIQQVSKRIEEIKGLIPLLKEGSRERSQKQLEYELALQQRTGLSKLFNEELGAETMRMHLSIYEDLEAAIGKLARDRGVDLVLRLDDADLQAQSDGEKSMKQVQNRLVTFERRQVWFATAQLDLTSDLIKMLQVPLERDEAPQDGSGQAGTARPGERGGN
jgi:Skp family chaperone for outer membrane proteins